MREARATFSPAAAPAAAKLCLWFYLAMLFISVAYIGVTGTLNGDFYGVPLVLTDWQFAAVVVISVAPYGVGYGMYRRFVRRAPPATVRVGNAILGTTFFVVTLWFIALAIKYDVGVLSRGIYEAPGLLKPFIQVTNRINPFYLGCFFIVGYQGSKKVLALGIALLIALGLLRAGLGVFMYVLLALAIRNHHSLKDTFRRHFFKLLGAILLLPMLTSSLYTLRGELREEAADVTPSLSAIEMVTARLVGRLSSISNTAFIFQESQQFRSDVRALDPWYFQRQIFSPLLGVSILPEVIPERLLINVHGGNWFDVSFMTGVPGNLTMAWFIHPLLAVINAATMILMIWLSFYFANKLALPYRNEVCFMLLLYPLTSGVGNEFSFIAVSMLALIVVFSLLRLFRIPGRACTRDRRQAVP